MSEEKRFPLQPEKGVTPGPLSCSWSVAEKSYGAYALRFGRSQSLETLAKRGGFSWGEMDDQYPAWREEESELARLRAENAEISESRRFLHALQVEYLKRAEAAEDKVDALTKERNDHRNAALEMREEVRKLYNLNQAIVPALQERVKELEADVQGRIATIKGLHGWKHVAEAKLAQMREVVEAAKAYVKEKRDRDPKWGAKTGFQKLFDALKALSRLTDAPEGKPCCDLCPETHRADCGGPERGPCPSCCPPSPGKDDGGKS